jgi:hypothetical protein
VSELAISIVFVDELQSAMLKNVAFLPTTILWTLVANASGYEASEEIAKVLITVKPKQFEHVLREIERQGAAAKYSCRRYADDYEQLLTSVPQGTTFSGVQVIRCFHKDESSGAVWVSVNNPPDEVLAVLYGVEGSKHKPLDGRSFLERFVSSLQKDPAVESACVLAAGASRCEP